MVQLDCFSLLVKALSLKNFNSTMVQLDFKSFSGNDNAEPDFNSTMVQLDSDTNTLNFYIPKFQFHYGSIRLKKLCS